MTNKEFFNKVLQQSRNLCSRSEKCRFDIKNFLLKKNISEIDIERIIEILINENYIDENRYVEFFVNDKLKFNKWGKIKIRYSLKQKQINDNIINDALSKIDANTYNKILISVMKQKSVSLKNKDLLKAKVSLIRFMSSKGFEYDLIMNFLDEIIKTK